MMGTAEAIHSDSPRCCKRIFQHWNFPLNLPCAILRALGKTRVGAGIDASI